MSSDWSSKRTRVCAMYGMVVLYLVQGKPIPLLWQAVHLPRTLFSSCWRLCVTQFLVDHPGLGLSLFVDDAACHSSGSEDVVASAHPAAVRDLIETLEGELTLTVSRSRVPWQLSDEAKTITIASG